MIRYPDPLPTLADELAMDEAMLVEAESGRAGPAVRVWEAPGLAVVLGASGRLAEEVDLDACRRDGVAIARRSSGGGTVVVGPGAPNVAVVLAIDADRRYRAVDEAQVAVLGRLAESIRARGRPVEVRGSGDLAIDGRKVSGSAQRRLKSHILIHATILDDFPIDRIGRYLKVPRRQPAYRSGRSHADFVANLGLGPGPLRDACLTAWLAPGESLVDAPNPLDLVARLASERFADPAWTSRF